MKFTESNIRKIILSVNEFDFHKAHKMMESMMEEIPTLDGVHQMQGAVHYLSMAENTLDGINEDEDKFNTFIGGLHNLMSACTEQLLFLMIEAEA